jgi:hypothetical protein
MFRVGFEPKTPVSELEKTVYVLDSAATVIGTIFLVLKNLLQIFSNFSILQTNIF